MKKFNTAILLTICLSFLSIQVNGQDVLFSDDFTYQTNWTVSGGTNGTITFEDADSSGKMMIVTSTGAANAYVGATAVLPSSNFSSNEITLSYSFYSEKIRHQIQLGKTPNRLQILCTDSGSETMRLCGEATGQANGAQFAIYDKSAWHTMKIVYNKTDKTAVFTIDEGTANAVVKSVDLSLQAAGYSFDLNSIFIRTDAADTFKIKNLKVTGSKDQQPLLYSDDFSFKKNWIENSSESGTLAFATEGTESVMTIQSKGSEYALTSEMPTFSITGDELIIRYDFYTTTGRSQSIFGTNPKRLKIIGESTVTTLRVCGEETTMGAGAKFLTNIELGKWHSMEIKYSVSARSAIFTVDGEKPSVATQTVLLSAQSSPYDFILDLAQLKALYSDIFKVKNLQVFGIGSSTANNPEGLPTSIVEEAGYEGLNIISLTKEGVLQFTNDLENLNSIDIKLYTVSGALVYEKTIENPSTGLQSVDLGSQIPGAYILALTNGKSIKTKKVLF